MTTKMAAEKRKQMLRDGVCVIEDVVPEAFLQELRNETERLIATHEEPADLVYQGQHIGVKREDNPVIEKLLSWEPSYQALSDLGFGDFQTRTGVIILTKEPNGTPPYWHQDWMQWNDPISLSPWPEIIFLNYYITDTSVENGCLKVIPGSHRRRFLIHDALVPAHEQGARTISEDHPIMFSDVPEQVFVPVKAGSLVLGDARVLHAAGRNFTNERRTLILSWHRRVRNTVPEYWEGEVPDEIPRQDPDSEFEGCRIPGKYLRADGS